MIALVEGAQRQKTPNEIALNILLASLTIVFLAATVDPAALRGLLRGRAVAGRARRAAGVPDPDHDRRAAVGHRHRRAWTDSCSTTCWRCPAAPSRPPATSTRCCWTRPARSRSATGRPPSSSRSPACADSRARRRRTAVQPRRRDARRAARSWCSPRPSTVCASAPPGELATAPVRAVHRADPDVRGRPRRRPPDPQGRGSRRHEVGARQRRSPDRRGRRDRRRHLHQRRYTARRGRVRRRAGTGPGRDQPQGRRQGGHARALRGDAAHGHPHRHDHRRQPADREGDRRGGGRRRLPRRGHARGQDGADPQGAGGRPAGRDDRGRHQRRPGAGPGRRRAWR